MSAEIRKKISYTLSLTLSERQLQALYNMMKYNIGPGELSEISNLRKEIWTACNEALKS